MNEQEQEQQSQIWYAYDSIDTWLAAAIELGSKTCDLNRAWREDSRHKREAGFDSGWTFDESRLNQKQFNYTSTLFLIAVNKAVRWGGTLKKLSPEATQAVDRFIQAVEPAKHVRDIREHDEEYFLGKGRRRDQLNHASEGGQIISDATSTIVNERGILLGGRTCVEETIAEAARLQQTLQGLAPRFGR